MLRPDPLPRRGPADVAIGGLRVAAILALLGVSTPVLLISTLAPRRADGTRGVHVVGQAICRAFVWLCGVRGLPRDVPALDAHRGLVFFNHPSFLDPVVMMAVRPVRYLAAAGVRSIPFVGPMARAAGTLFVDRGDAGSRSAARDAVREALDDPTPVALAPEGGIWKDEGVGPLRYGAFEVAAGADAEILLVALDYSDRRRVAWHDGEWLLAPLWRVCARARPVWAEVQTVGTLDAAAAAPEAVADQARRRLSAALGVPLPESAPA